MSLRDQNLERGARRERARTSSQQRLRAIRAVDEPRLSALVISARTPAVEALETQFEPGCVILATNHEEVVDALCSSAIVTMVAVGVDAEHADELTKLAFRTWPTTGCVWFARRNAIPVVPDDLSLHGIEALGPFRDDAALASELRHRIEAEQERRSQEIEAARAFAKRHGLGPVATIVMVHLALGLSTAQSRDRLDYPSKEAFHDFCRKQIMPRTGGTMSETKGKLLAFVRQRMLAARGPKR